MGYLSVLLGILASIPLIGPFHVVGLVLALPFLFLAGLLGGLVALKGAGGAGGARAAERANRSREQEQQGGPERDHVSSRDVRCRGIRTIASAQIYRNTR